MARSMYHKPAQIPTDAAAIRRAERHLSVLRRRGMFSRADPSIRLGWARTPGEFSQAYRLVHDSFVERGYIKPHPVGMRLRVYEALPEMATFVALHENKVVGVQSILSDTTSFGLPSDASFQQEIDALRSGGRFVCEGTNQAVDPAWRKSALPTELMQVALAYALDSSCQELITTVSPTHASFYALMGFRQVSQARSYSREVDDPTVVMAMDTARFRSGDIHVSSIISDFMLKWAYTDNPYRSSLRQEAQQWDEGQRVSVMLSVAIREAAIHTVLEPAEMAQLLMHLHETRGENGPVNRVLAEAS